MADSTVTNQIGFAPEIAPFAISNLEAAKTAVAAPYQSYADWAKKYNLSGDQVAAFQDLQKTAFGTAKGLTQDPYSLTSAGGLQDLAQQAGQLSYQPNQFNAQQVGTQSFTGQGTADQYMSPYMQSVVDIQKREAQRQAGIQGTQQQAQAVQSGAFGGARDAIMRAERERNLGTQMNDIQAQGSQAAYQQAQQQFNAEQQARLAAQQSNQQANMNAQQQAEQSKQFGANYGLQGTQTGLQGFSALGSQGQNLYGQTTGNMNLQNALGTQQQQQVQNLLNVGQQNYTAEQNYPYKQIGFMSDVVRGAPLSNLGSELYKAQPSTFNQVAGLGTSLFGATMKAKGGSIKSKKPAGLAALLIHGMK